MTELLVSLVLLLTGGLAAVGFRARSKLCHKTGQAGAVTGSVFGLAGAVRILVTARPESLATPWPMPGGGLHIEIDALSAFFLLPVFGLSLAAAVYGRAYLTGRAERAAGCWFHMNLLTIGMALVVS